MSIELVIQTPSGRIPIKAEPSTTLAQVVGAAAAATMDDDDPNQQRLRYLQTSVHKSQWETMTLQNLGLARGARALLILESDSINTTTTTQNSRDVVVMPDASKNDSALSQALFKILNHNFDDDSKVCLVTLMKVIDNVLQKPGNAKVRTIRLSNSAFREKVVSKGGVDYLLATGFVVRHQSTAPELLSLNNNKKSGEECLVLLSEHESTSVLIQARRLLLQTCISELNMSADDLPKYKPPAVGTTAIEFNPYKSNRHNATGQPQQPDAYESTTETKLKQLQSRQERLEAQLQGQQLQNRELVALRPPNEEEEEQQQQVHNITTTTTTTSAPPSSDGALLAQRLKRLEQERREREEGGFTTKAMRELQKMKHQKVYSHAKLRIQFPDASAIEAKFLPKETVETVKRVVRDCLVVSPHQHDFDLYVAPPRRLLNVSQTLEQEGLVPAAKCFVSWKGGGGPATTTTNGAFIKEHLFQSPAAAPCFPIAKPVVQEEKKKNDNNVKPAAKPKKSSREEDLLARMMGGSSGGGGGGNTSKKASDEKKSGKPKWFKG
jgi:hypothetical protein